ncbi:MAG: VTT domain-containing protein [Deltaproteobacteria bacterium]|nr:VTT domain-containing protein [Deltaproteobacteria bacterium]
MTRDRIILALLVLAGTGLLGLVVFLNWTPLWERIVTWCALVRDREQVEAFLRVWGPIGAPIAFVVAQVLQVLTAGSAINFAVGRVLGRRYVAKWIPDNHLRKFDALAKRQGAILFFALFVLPGFPKDYLCIFLGLTSLSAKVFILMAGIGRMPGTLMLSLQGAQVFQKDHTTLALLIAITLAFVIPACIWRASIAESSGDRTWVCWVCWVC